MFFYEKKGYRTHFHFSFAGSVRIKQNYNYLTLCEVKIFGEPSDVSPLVNLASGRGLPTTQTSVAHNGAASRAVDGRTNGIWNQGTCTHSANAGKNHWQVDLLDEKSVSKVVIHNRRDCCQDRIDGAQVIRLLFYKHLQIKNKI